MCDYRSGNPFFLRVEGNDWHSSHILSEFALVHETTKGPLDPTETLFAPWPSEPSDQSAVLSFLASIEERGFTMGETNNP